MRWIEIVSLGKASLLALATILGCLQQVNDIPNARGSYFKRCSIVHNKLKSHLTGENNERLHFESKTNQQQRYLQNSQVSSQLSSSSCTENKCGSDDNGSYRLVQCEVFPANSESSLCNIRKNYIPNEQTQGVQELFEQYGKYLTELENSECEFSRGQAEVARAIMESRIRIRERSVNNIIETSRIKYETSRIRDETSRIRDENRESEERIERIRERNREHEREIEALRRNLEQGENEQSTDRRSVLRDMVRSRAAKCKVSTGCTDQRYNDQKFDIEIDGYSKQEVNDFLVSLGI